MLRDSVFSQENKRDECGVDELASRSRPEPQKKTIGILHTNIQCITNKIEAFENNLRHINPHVVCVVEHWLHRGNKNLFNLEDYLMADCFIRLRHGHGGACIFVKRGLSFVPVKFVGGLSIEKTCEMACIWVPSHDLIVMSVYRSPDSDLTLFCDTFGSAMELLMEKYNTKTQFAIAGDFNVNIKSTSVQTITLLNLMRSYGLESSVHDYTRIQGESKTALDNVYTNISSYTVRIIPGLSDHLDVLSPVILAKYHLQPM